MPSCNSQLSGGRYFVPPIDPLSDLYEIGLVAAASPEFMETFVRALLAAARQAEEAGASESAAKAQSAA